MSLSVSGLTKAYPGGRGIQDVSFGIEAGEVVALVGPSGCGKTTTLRIIAGLETADDGSVDIDGVTIAPIAPSKRRLSYTFQSPVLFEQFTVEQNILLPRLLDQLPWWRFLVKSRKKQLTTDVTSLLERFEIGHLVGRRAENLSGGEAQRISLARALSSSARILLLDEPLSNVDPSLRAEIRSVLAAYRYSRNGSDRNTVSMLYVTHDQDDVLELADRMLVMESGTITQSGKPEELYAHPSTLFAARFFRYPHLNVLRGTAVRSGNGFADIITDASKTPFSFALKSDRVSEGDPVYLAFRSNEVRIVQDMSGSSLAIRGTLARIRTTPFGTIGVIVVGNKSVQFDVAVGNWRSGQSVVLELETANLFDGHNGRHLGWYPSVREG